MASQKANWWKARLVAISKRERTPQWFSLLPRAPIGAVEPLPDRTGYRIEGERHSALGVTLPRIKWLEQK